ncbi:MAG TPA: aspartate aminotransferase family protein [Candidatus Acidoferrales bacterium]|jgi:ornithine--oxo-acid transaminase|nr:aspartate aminotransferase family protein [Candidatus Acidoferrales bacterium]
MTNMGTKSAAAPSVATARATSNYQEYVNPQWVTLLNLLGMNVVYERCLGCELFTRDGRRVLDFLSGYCVHNTGHNHPYIIEALKEEMDRCGPAMLQSHVPEIAGELARRLCELAGGGLKKVYFGSSGSEGVEAAIKFARATTGRAGIVYAKSSFHGLTAGALSLMSDAFWREGFGPLLADTEGVAYGDLAALESALGSKRHAAFVVEPLQAEGGIHVPSRAYLQGAQEACRRTGTLFVLDEVQTGMYRTGTFLAAHQFDVRPDMVVLAKALSGGLMPVSAVLMTDKIYEAVYSSLKRAIVHTSTFSENSLSMRAGLATLDVLEREDLGARALELGEMFRAKLRRELAGFEMVKEVRGMGLLNGIEFVPPKKLALRALYEAFYKVHPAMFGQIVVMRMFREKGILTQICGNNFMVLKAAPPLTVTTEQLDEFVEGIREVVELAETSPTFWTEALGMVRRAVNI